MCEQLRISVTSTTWNLWCIDTQAKQDVTSSYEKQKSAFTFKYNLINELIRLTHSTAVIDPDGSFIITDVTIWNDELTLYIYRSELCIIVQLFQHLYNPFMGQIKQFGNLKTLDQHLNNK